MASVQSRYVSCCRCKRNLLLGRRLFSDLVRMITFQWYRTAVRHVLLCKRCCGYHWSPNMLWMPFCFVLLFLVCLVKPAAFVAFGFLAFYTSHVSSLRQFISILLYTWSIYLLYSQNDDESTFFDWVVSFFVIIVNSSFKCSNSGHFVSSKSFIFL